MDTMDIAASSPDNLFEETDLSDLSGIEFGKPKRSYYTKLLFHAVRARHARITGASSACMQIMLERMKICTTQTHLYSSSKFIKHLEPIDCNIDLNNNSPSSTVTTRSVHESRRDFACDSCEKKFGYKTVLLKHQRTVHEGRRDYSCDKCENKFGLISNLIRHQMTVHDGHKDYACDKCEKKFGKTADLIRHQNAVHDSRKIFAYDHCEKKFGYKHHLVEHQKTVQEGHKDFECDNCDRKFGQKSN
ncbi:unnamed protein product [Trichogramma brassicae]|uniref:C2H2-type domain-containing protein n=1 Tax=Trichogramma brassicae TaxID=86971 RepID=A0A6H5IFW5_9HYME|nr:unnamed protein product [Trichogramma brassicae]